MIEAVLIDLSGVIYQGDRIIDGAPEALHDLRSAGVPYRFLTNTTRSSRAQVVSHLEQLGIPLDHGQLMTASDAAKLYLEEHGLRPHLMVHPNLRVDFEGFEQQRPNAVVVGDMGSALDYDAMNAAFRILVDDARLIALGDNRYFREADGLSLDAGPFVHALEYAVGMGATVIGKPDKAFYHAAIADMNVPPTSVVMIGDDAVADVRGAIRAGLRGILVRTGKYRPGDGLEIADVRPVICDDFPQAVDLILRERATHHHAA